MLNTRPALDVFPAQRDLDGWNVQHNRTPPIEPARFPIRTTEARTTVRTGQHGPALYGVIPCLARDLGRCDTDVAIMLRRPPATAIGHRASDLPSQWAMVMLNDVGADFALSR